MDELLKLLAAEGLYQIMRAEAWRGGVALTRLSFVATVHVVSIGLDALLHLNAGGFLPDVGKQMASARGVSTGPRFDRASGRIIP